MGQGSLLVVMSQRCIPPKTVEEAVSIVKDASDKGLPVRASGVSFPLSTLPSAFEKNMMF